MTLQANLEDPDAFYLIMEDDSYPVHDFETRYPAVLAELRTLPARWHWVYLAVHETFAHLNTKSIAGKQLINDAPRMYGNAGYLLSRDGARAALEGILPCGEPKDEAINLLITRKGLRAYCVKEELIGVRGQQVRGFNKSLGLTGRDSELVFKSNIWDNR